jgi:hypothetical protein
MSRIYRALQKAERVHQALRKSGGLTAFDPDPSTNGMLGAGGLPEIPASLAADKTQAVTDLIRNNLLTHNFGVQGEWEVRTTFVANRHAWRYRSSVCVHGKEVRKDFPPIDCDRTRHIRQAEAVTEDMLAAFAREAVAAHFARCASVAEYSLMASVFSQPPLWLQRIKRVALVLLSVAVLLTAYWWWRDANRTVLEQPESKPSPHRVRWQGLRVTHHAPAGEPFEFPLPALAGVSEGLPVEVTIEASGDAPSWLELDRERLSIRGTAPVTAAGQTYRLSVRVHAEEGSDSRLFIVLTITGQPDRMTPPPQLPIHWTW